MATSPIAQPAQPTLRLVGVDDAPRADAPAQRRIAKENASAASLHDADARLLFARQVAARIEGGRAAVLRPQRRSELVGAAVDMGLRRFDANLIIAIVQDAARRGESLEVNGVRQAAQRSSRARELVSMVPAARENANAQALRLIGIAVGVGVFLLGVLIALMGH